MGSGTEIEDLRVIRRRELGLKENEKQYTVYIEGGHVAYVVADSVVEDLGVTYFKLGGRTVGQFGRILGWTEGDV